MYKKTTENRKFTQILLKETLIWCYMDTNRLQSTCESNADWRSVSVSNKSRRQERPAVKASSSLLPPLTLSSWADGSLMISMGGGRGVWASSSCSSSPPLCIPEDVLERRLPSLLRTLWSRQTHDTEPIREDKSHHLPCCYKHHFTDHTQSIHVGLIKYGVTF